MFMFRFYWFVWSLFLFMLLSFPNLGTKPLIYRAKFQNGPIGTKMVSIVSFVKTLFSFSLVNKSFSFRFNFLIILCVALKIKDRQNKILFQTLKFIPCRKFSRKFKRKTTTINVIASVPFAHTIRVCMCKGK